MIKVLKFGGASVKDADSVRNVASILRNYSSQHIVVVISAMGKTTNALERILQAWVDKDDSLHTLIEELICFHNNIANQLFDDKNHKVFDKMNNIFEKLHGFESNLFSRGYDYYYDQVVSLGELLCTVIVHEYLLQQNIKNQWFDARELIRTDETWREGKVDWNITQHLVNEALLGLFNQSDTAAIALTQGFIGGTTSKHTSTLGREGSDYTAAIFSYILNADEMIVWKDVPGIMNADPKYFENTNLLTRISYREAIELTYYGASVIHPKTIKPLQNKNIPLRVKSFLNPEAQGTTIGANTSHDENQPSIILKPKQVLMSFLVKDFSFIAENNLSDIFTALSATHIRVNLMQQSAISFTICFDENMAKMNQLFEILGEKFDYRYNTNVQLITIRHFHEKLVNSVLKNRHLLIEQRSRQTAQFVVK